MRIPRIQPFFNGRSNSQLFCKSQYYILEVQGLSLKSPLDLSLVHQTVHVQITTTTKGIGIGPSQTVESSKHCQLDSTHRSTLRIWCLQAPHNPCLQVQVCVWMYICMFGVLSLHKPYLQVLLCSMYVCVYVCMFGVFKLSTIHICKMSVYVCIYLGHLHYNTDRVA
jgi:hypothetical protein